jgi:hypothetical protein
LELSGMEEATMLELLKTEDRLLLTKELIDALLTIDALQGWLRAHYPAALPHLGAEPLQAEVTRLLTWANSVDGMHALLQLLVDHPPGPRIPWLIYAWTHAKIEPRARTRQGLPIVSPDRSWFAASRPFVNRGALRQHLKDLEVSAGAQAVLVIDGEERTGKSFAVSLALGFESAQTSHPPLDIDEFARAGAQLNARDLAVLIAGDNHGSPPFDVTKEDEAVPHLMVWLTSKLRGRKLWIIIDHCNRRVLTQAARSILTSLATRLRSGALPDVRLILVDFDRNELPQQWRNQIRYDQAQLPDERCVEDWCLQLATAAKRLHPPGAPAQWANEVFAKLMGRSLADGSWHAELEQQLQETVERIMACDERP